MKVTYLILKVSKKYQLNQSFTKIENFGIFVFKVYFEK